eukprot:174758_1
MADTWILHIFLSLYLRITGYKAFVFDTFIGPQTLPRSLRAHAVGYNYANKTVLLFGSKLAPKQFTQFDPITSQFKDANETYLTQSIYGNGQFYSQQGSILWIIKPSGDSLYTINTQTYTERDPHISIPVSVSYKSCLTSTETYLFTIGGQASDNTQLNLVQVYNLTSESWFNAPSLQLARIEAACVAIGHQLYTIGGKNAALQVSYDSIERLYIDTFDNNWSFITGTLSEKMGSLAAVAYKDNILVIGGMARTLQIQSYVHLIHTQSESVQVVGSLAASTSHTVVIIIDDVLYIFGGWELQNVYQYAVLPTTQPTSAPTVEQMISTAFSTTTLSGSSSPIPSRSTSVGLFDHLSSTSIKLRNAVKKPQDIVWYIIGLISVLLCVIIFIGWMYRQRKDVVVMKNIINGVKEEGEAGGYAVEEAQVKIHRHVIDTRGARHNNANKVQNNGIGPQEHQGKMLNENKRPEGVKPNVFKQDDIRTIDGTKGVAADEFIVEAEDVDECTDCLQMKEGKLYNDELFYCNECWELYT